MVEERSSTPPALDIFTPVRSGNAFEETVSKLAGAIKARLFSPGDRLPPERELARHLGVSRSTLREALRVLVEAGYLEVRVGRHGGTFVARWPEVPRGPRQAAVLERMRDELPGLLDYRRALEPTAAELAALRASEEDIAHLEHILNEMRGMETVFDQYRAGDARFHVRIAQAAKSPLILRGVIEVQTALTEILDLIVYHSRRTLLHSTEYHWQIFDAISQREPQRARQTMLDHIIATEHIIHGLIPEADWPLEVPPAEHSPSGDSSDGSSPIQG